MKRRQFLRSASAVAVAAACSDACAAPMAIIGGPGKYVADAGEDAYIPRDPQVGDLFIDTEAVSDGDGTEGSPWNAWSEARFQSLSAGQQLVIMGGGTIDMVEARGLASGTSSNRIVVRPYPGHSPTINFPTGGCVVGGGDYWDWYGLNITCTDTGFALPGNNPNSGAAVPIANWRFIDLNAVKGSGGTTDNSGIIYMLGSGVDYISIIRGSYVGPGGESFSNRSGIFIDRTKHVEVIGAYVAGHCLPIYYKHNHQDSEANVSILFKNCIIAGGTRGMLQCVAYAQYINCAFDDASLDFSDDGGDPAGDYNQITNCTFLASGLTMNPPQVPATTDLVVGAFGNILRNNLFVGASSVWDNRYGANSNMDQETDTDYNAFPSGGSVYGRNGTATYSLADYKTAFSDQEVNSIAGSASLVGGATPGATPANWALDAGTFATAANGQAGNNGADRGVDASKLLTVN